MYLQLPDVGVLFSTECVLLILSDEMKQYYIAAFKLIQKIFSIGAIMQTILKLFWTVLVFHEQPDRFQTAGISSDGGSIINIANNCQPWQVFNPFDIMTQS